jgi:ABC-type multidrug transport system fused ATPase/permease subunit
MKMHKRSDQKPSFFQLMRSGLSLLTHHEKIKTVSLAILMAAVNWLSTISVLAMLLVVSLILQPDSMTTNRYLATLNKILGSLPISEFVIALAAGVALLTILSSLGEWVLEYLLNRFGASCQNRLAKQLMDRCVSAPYAWFLMQNSTALARFLYDDVAVWNRGFVQRCMTIVNNLIQVVVVSIVVLWAMTWIGIVAMLLVAAIGYLGLRLTRPKIDRFSVEKRNALESTMLSATQVLAGIRDVKLSSREDYFVEKFSESYATTTRTYAQLNMLQITPPAFLKLVGQVGLMGIVIGLWITGSSIAGIAIQIGLLYLVTVRFVPAISTISSLFGNLLNAAPYIGGIRHLMQSIDEITQKECTEMEDTKPPAGDWETISMVGMGFQYPNSSEPALKNIGLKIERGQAYAIVGRSAAGKSTLVDLIVALLPPSEGKIYVDNRPLTDFSIKSWRSRTGYVSQSPYISDDTLRANVAFGIDRKKVDDVWVMECLRLANLGDISDQLESGLDTRLGERGIRLSGGQRQRIAIARALFNRPEILILDEATSALDTISEKEIMGALENLHHRITVIIIAHRLTTVMNCDRIFLLDDGRLVAQGSYSELMANHKLFRQMAAGLIDAEMLMR